VGQDAARIAILAGGGASIGDLLPSGVGPHWLYSSRSFRINLRGGDFRRGF